MSYIKCWETLGKMYGRCKMGDSDRVVVFDFMNGAYNLVRLSNELTEQEKAQKMWNHMKQYSQHSLRLCNVKTVGSAMEQIEMEVMGNSSHTIPDIKKNIEALQQSRIKWKTNLAILEEGKFEGVKTSWQDCPLCRLYVDNSCEECPIKLHSGRMKFPGSTPCQDTPYGSFIRCVDKDLTNAIIHCKKEIDLLSELIEIWQGKLKEAESPKVDKSNVQDCPKTSNDLRKCYNQERMQPVYRVNDFNPNYVDWLETKLLSRINDEKESCVCSPRKYEIVREHLVDRLAELYKTERAGVARICDEALDKSGALLGEVRSRYIKG